MSSDLMAASTHAARAAVQMAFAAGCDSRNEPSPVYRAMALASLSCAARELGYELVTTSSLHRPEGGRITVTESIIDGGRMSENSLGGENV